MRRVGVLGVVALAALGISLAEEMKMDAPALKAGEMAPPFSLPGSDGESYSLEQFKGKKAVVIAWFPKAFTGG